MLSDLGAFIMTDILMMIFFSDSLFPCFSSMASYKLVELSTPIRYLFILAVYERFPKQI